MLKQAMLGKTCAFGDLHDWCDEFLPWGKKTVSLCEMYGHTLAALPYAVDTKS